MNQIKKLLLLFVAIILVSCGGGASSSAGNNNSENPSNGGYTVGYLPNGSSVWISQKSFSLSAGSLTSGSMGFSGGLPGYTYELKFNVSPTSGNLLVTPSKTTCKITSGTSDVCQINIDGSNAVMGEYTVTILYNLESPPSNVTVKKNRAVQAQDANSGTVGDYTVMVFDGGPTIVAGDINVSALDDSSIDLGSMANATVTLSGSSGITTPVVFTIVSNNANIMQISPVSCSLTTESNNCNIQLLGIAEGTTNFTVSATGYNEAISPSLTVNQPRLGLSFSPNNEFKNSILHNQLATNTLTLTNISDGSFESDFIITLPTNNKFSLIQNNNKLGCTLVANNMITNTLSAGESCSILVQYSSTKSEPNNSTRIGINYSYRQQATEIKSQSFVESGIIYETAGLLFTWESGSNMRNEYGRYPETVGMAGGYPGARWGAVSWGDESGNLWLFGGNGYDSLNNQGSLNDLWSYNISSKTWTWESGSNLINESGRYPATVGMAGGCPGARFDSLSWIDESGNLWLFGGQGYASLNNSGYLNDLWSYNISSKTWTWGSGSNMRNESGRYPATVGMVGGYPGARSQAISWVDKSGNLWLFGGYGYGSTSNGGKLNDLWSYNIPSKTWTWESGSNMIDESGRYPADVGMAGGYPGARSYSISWVDESGNLFLFGGIGYDSLNNHGYLNDLWSYNVSSKTWTWESGSNMINESGLYPGTVGMAGGYPGSRFSSVSWIDKSGNLWLFGGQGYDSLNNSGFLNDLWSYNIPSKTWTWESGSNMIDEYGRYPATVGIDGGYLGGRSDGVSWVDKSGNLWLFGGFGYDSTSNRAWLNDLWQIH